MGEAAKAGVSVRYVGVFDAVEVRLPDELAEFEGQRVSVARGDTYETTAEQAGALLEQSDAWRKVNPSKTDRGQTA